MARANSVHSTPPTNAARKHRKNSTEVAKFAMTIERPMFPARRVDVRTERSCVAWLHPGDAQRPNASPTLKKPMRELGAIVDVVMTACRYPNFAWMFCSKNSN